jgi:hypothetical protein
MPDHPLATLRKLDPGFMKHVDDTDALVYADGALPRKFKLLIALPLCRLVRAQGHPGVDSRGGNRSWPILPFAPRLRGERLSVVVQTPAVGSFDDRSQDETHVTGKVDPVSGAFRSFFEEAESGDPPTDQGHAQSGHDQGGPDLHPEYRPFGPVITRLPLRPSGEDGRYQKDRSAEKRHIGGQFEADRGHEKMQDLKSERGAEERERKMGENNVPVGPATRGRDARRLRHIETLISFSVGTVNVRRTDEGSGRSVRVSRGD